MKSFENRSMASVANEIELEPLGEMVSEGRPVLASLLPLLGSVKVRVSVRVGSVETSVGALTDLKQGAVLTLDRLVEEPLDVLIDGHVIARGTLVAVGDHFGVRITETAALGLSGTQD